MENLHQRKSTRPYLIAEAAAIAGKSQSWVRNHRRFGPLVPAAIEDQQAVTAASLHDYLAELTKRKPRRKRADNHLRLVVDNTK